MYMTIMAEEYDKEQDAKTMHTYSRMEENGRMAVVLYKPKSGFYVNLFENNKLIERREVYNHSEQYAENVAENYVDGMFHPGDNDDG